MRDDYLASKFLSRRYGLHEIRARCPIVAICERHGSQVVESVTHRVLIAELSEDRYGLIKKHLSCRIVFFHER